MKNSSGSVAGRDENLYPVASPGAQPPSTEVRYHLPEFEEVIDLHDYLDVVIRRRWIILAVLTCVFITSLIVTLKMRPIYRAEGRIEFNYHSPKVTKFQDVVESQPQFQAKEIIQTQVQLLKSRSLAQRVIQKLQLDQAFAGRHSDEEGGETSKEGAAKRWYEAPIEWLKGGSKTEEETADAKRLDSIRTDQNVQNAFLGRLQVTPQRDTSIIIINFSFTDAALTQNVVNSLIQEFIGWRMDTKIDSASTAKQQLEKQIQLDRIQLEKSEATLNDFAQKARIVSLEPNLNLVYRQLEETNRALAEARTRRMAQEAIYRQTEVGDIASLPQVVESKLIQELRRNYIDLLGQYEEQSATFGENYPKLKSLKAKMQDTQRKISLEESRIAGAIKHQYNTTLNEEEELQKDAQDKESKALDLNSKAAQFKIYQREVEANKQIHQSLLERFKEIDATVGTDMTNVRVVDYADLPVFPYRPNIPLNLSLAIAVGLIGGVGLAFMLEYMDNTIKRLDEIADRFQISVLGVLPFVSDTVKLDFIVNQKPKASFSEAIRTTKVSIQLSSSRGTPPKKLLLTSTSAGEGKSTVVCNLAQAFSASEEKVVIIDCDLRKPRLHRVFSKNSRSKIKGLSQYLSRICQVEDIVQKTEIENLYFIPAGPIPPNPAELLASSSMKQLLETLCERFDRVIIDGPPAAGFADVLVLGSQVDGVILVSTLGETHREALRIFRKSIHNVQCCLLGCIVNKFNVSYRYGSYYYKYYKYYHYSYKPYGEKTEQLTE
jgi:capsular exopolysaccharide synthesis family protein